MGLFVLIGRDGQDVALRKLHREAHLARLRPLAADGRVVFAGPIFDDDGETPRGSVVVFDAPSLDAARRFVASDPYVAQGVFERWEVLPTRQVLPGADPRR